MIRKILKRNLFQHRETISNNSVWHFSMIAHQLSWGHLTYAESIHLDKVNNLATKHFRARNMPYSFSISRASENSSSNRWFSYFLNSVWINECAFKFLYWESFQHFVQEMVEFSLELENGFPLYLRNDNTTLLFVLDSMEARLFSAASLCRTTFQLCCLLSPGKHLSPRAPKPLLDDSCWISVQLSLKKYKNKHSRRCPSSGGSNAPYNWS